MFSYLRSFLPEKVNTGVMYCTGKANCFFQYYIDNTFSASAITDRIFVGNLASASNNTAMKEQGITHILSTMNGLYEIYPTEFKYKIIHLNDDKWVNIGDYFDEANEFIDQALSNPQSKIMIHCQRGISRSVSFLLAYLLFKLNQEKQIPKESVDDIIKEKLNEVKTHRSIADPNEGFIEALKMYVYKLNGYVLDLPKTQESLSEKKLSDPITILDSETVSTMTIDPTQDQHKDHFGV